MRLYFTVPDTLQTQNGTLVRNFLRQCAVSTELARAVKFQGGGFFADGASVLANRRVYPGQVLSFDLPPEAGGVAPQSINSANFSGASGLVTSICAVSIWSGASDRIFASNSVRRPAIPILHPCLRYN